MPRSTGKKGSGKGHRKSETLWPHCDTTKNNRSNDLAAWANADQTETRRLRLPTIDPELPQFSKPYKALHIQGVTMAKKQTGFPFPPIHRQDHPYSDSPTMSKSGAEDSEKSHIIIGSPRASAGAYTRTFEHSLLRKSGNREGIKLSKIQIRTNESLTVDHSTLSNRASTPPLASPARLPPIDFNQVPFIPVNKMDFRIKSSPARRCVLSAQLTNRFPELVIHGNNAPRCKVDIENKMSKADKSNQRQRMVHVDMHLLR